MSWSRVGNTVCPIARSLAVLGDRWTMLILREAFLGSRRFEEFQAQTGMSSHLLSIRLKRLERDKILDRVQYADRPVRHEYRLTERGRDLYPILLGLKAWGEKWGGLGPGEEPALTIIHSACGAEISLALKCPSCGGAFGPRDAQVTLSSGLERERATRGTAFQSRRSGGARDG
ncbi:winged helix-turn-helix transcriptional regulator [Rhodoligotrophos defluvii]|uniref:winged helix-turn-helix transcriptional regulator n=1 Tax=Rhodoligotrophos defluvii TaxID=2561934 RepID=UPI0010C9CEE3|nr:helix-turn-helix domain-containing protein [Rhodoligotrophos defluvii]